MTATADARTLRYASKRRLGRRHHSSVPAMADALIAGCGTQGYVLAPERMATILKDRATT